MTTIKPNVDAITLDRAWQVVSANTKLDSSASPDVVASGKGSFILNYRLSIGRQSTTAFTANSPVGRLLLSRYLSTESNEEWVLFNILQPAVGASIAGPTINGATSAAAEQLVVSANTNLAVGESIFISDGTIANGEIVEIARINSTTIDVSPPMKNAHANATQIYGQAIFANGQVDLTPWRRFKFQIDNRGNAVAIAARLEWNLVSSYDAS